MDQFRPATELLKAMAHPARWRILNALREGEECVCHLTALLHRRQAYVSQQLMFLREAGLIEDRKEGWRVYYRLKDWQLVAVLDALNALAGIKRSDVQGKILPSCPCPKCSGAERQEHRGQRDLSVELQAVTDRSLSIRRR